MQEDLIYIKNNLIDTDGGMYLTFDSLIEINNLIDTDGDMYLTFDPLIEMKNIITGSNNITLRKLL